MGMVVPKPLKKEEFGEHAWERFVQYVKDNTKSTKAKTRGVREELMPKWIRIYRGIPAEENKTWPWPGASNLIIQVAATHSDELLSRVMAIYQNDPLFVAQILGDFDIDSEDGGEDQKQIIEKFLEDMAFEPNELDLYRVEQTGSSSAIRYGTGIYTFPWEYVTEKQYVYIGGGTEPGEKGTYQENNIVRRDGPHPEVVPLSDWLIDPKYPNLNQAPFKGRTLHLSYYQVEEMLEHDELWDKEVVEGILKNPTPISEVRRQLEEQKKVEIDSNRASEEFDIEELWGTYRHNKENIRFVARYDLINDKFIGAFYNPYPENDEPFEDSKLAYDEDTYFGYGFCEMLESYQREVSTTHNWRIDNRHFATTGVGRVNKNSKLSSTLQIYPGVMIPADEGEVEPLAFGVQSLQYGTEDEELTLRLASARVGVDPADSGSGGGAVNAKRGIYSSQGTMATLQQKNNRNNLRMSDMRSAHVRIGRKLLRLYAYFGIGDRTRKYGDRAEILKKALENYKAKKLGLVIRAATASTNRELDRQNDILLTTTLERIWQSDAQMTQALATPGMPPELKDLYLKQMKAKNFLVQTLLRNFGHQDAARLLPVPDFLKKEHSNATGANGSSSNSQPTTQQTQGSGGMVPVGVGGVSGQIPQFSSGAGDGTTSN